MKFRTTIDFDITDECLEYFYNNSIDNLREKLDAYFKRLVVIDFNKCEGLQAFYRSINLKEETKEKNDCR
ncbi:MAG: hypothetical protein E7J43_00075 [Finegoldia magna]|nr:hypothetical protein [Finegoldia magna]